jgi:acetyl esterase/lipase
MANARLESLREMLRERQQETITSIEQARRRLEDLATLTVPLPGTRFEAVRAGDVAGEWTTAPGARDDGSVVYLHGGGYGLGSVATHRALVSRLSRASGFPVLAVDYRLAPEHPLPAAVEDAVEAVRWLRGRGTASDDVVLAGDSAGGGLAVATLLALRERGEPLPAGAVCLSPWVDLEATGESTTAHAHCDPMVSRDELLLMAALYLRGADPRSPLASPVHGDLRGLPPLLVQVGTSEALLDDAVRLVERVRAAGGEARLERWRDMIHVWHAFAPLLPEARAAIARAGAWIRARLGRRGRPLRAPRRAVRPRATGSVRRRRRIVAR